MDERPRIAFWMHQATEYLLGVLLFLTALRQVGAAMVYTLAGGLLLTGLAAVTAGPLAAFRWLSRPTHRVLDMALVAFLAASPLLLRFRSWGLVIVAEGMALALATLARRTAYVDPPKPPRRPRPPVTPIVNNAARAAGHLLGKAGADAPHRLGRFVGRHKRPPS